MKRGSIVLDDQGNAFEVLAVTEGGLDLSSVVTKQCYTAVSPTEVTLAEGLHPRA